MCRLLLAVPAETDPPDEDANWLSRPPDGTAPSPARFPARCAPQWVMAVGAKLIAFPLVSRRAVH
jgi:hypothetical protein